MSLRHRPSSAARKVDVQRSDIDPEREVAPNAVSVFLETAILRFIVQNPWCLASDVTDRFPQLNLEYTQQVLQRLVAREVLWQTGGGRAARYAADA